MCVIVCTCVLAKELVNVCVWDRCGEGGWEKTEREGCARASEKSVFACVSVRACAIVCFCVYVFVCMCLCVCVCV